MDAVSADEASKILMRSRGFIDRLQLQGKLSPVPTIYPKYFFLREQVLAVKEKLTAKKASNEKA